MRKGLRVMLKKDSMYHYQSRGDIGTIEEYSNKNWWYIVWDWYPTNRLPYPEKDIIVIDFNKYIDLCKQVHIEY